MSANPDAWTWTRQSGYTLSSPYDAPSPVFVLGLSLRVRALRRLRHHWAVMACNGPGGKLPVGTRKQCGP